jgi:hypothetical protein
VFAIREGIYILYKPLILHLLNHTTTSLVSLAS